MPLELERPEWQAQAACRGVGASLFFGDDTTGPARMVPWLLCDGCPVRQACLEQVMADERHLALPWRFGLWAFSTPAQRYAMDRGELYEADGRRCGSVKGYQLHRLAGTDPCWRCQRRWDWYVSEHRGEVAQLQPPVPNGPQQMKGTA